MALTDISVARATEREESPPAVPAADRRRGLYASAGKRALDLVVGVPLLLLALPMIGVLAILVLRYSGWPPFHVCERVGRGGRTFRMWKLRTMVPDAGAILDRWLVEDPEIGREFRVDFKLADDPRITSVGRWLRATSLDELPQLWNVVRGDISLVGPRPVVRDELARYGGRACELLSVRPGLTGRWQVSGRNAVGYPRRAEIELSYAESLSFREDVRILARSVLTPFRFDGR